MFRISFFVSLIFAAGTLCKVTLAGELPIDIHTEVEGVTYLENVPAPEAVIGHVIGTRHTLPHQVVEYYRSIAERSNRVSLGKHGQTYENRPLIHAIVTSPENHARIEEIRQANLLLSERPEEVSQDLLARMPAVVNMGFSIHGNEASGTEAAMLLIYHLAAGQGAPVDEVLQNLVIIIDPSLNPDGRSRFANWVNRYRGEKAVSDPQDMEHNEPWPGGRTNHYWFDMNRDWLPVQLRESKGRLQLFHHWRPQLLTDFHEMGSESTFFFQPGVPIRNNPNTPQRVFDLTERIGKYHASALDEIGSLYYNKETYDDFYYGKGSTYPDINGSLGILFEQASSRALQRETRSGVLTYPFTIRNQFTAALSTLEAAVALRQELLKNQRDFYAEAPAFAEASQVKGYLLDQSRSPHRTFLLADTLKRHRIRIFELARDVEVNGRRFPKETALVVPLDQPQARLIQAAMEKVTTFQDSIFYDVSTWTFPLAFGVESVELDRPIEPLLGPEIEEPIERISGELVGGQARYAYVMEWGDYYAGRALYRIQSAGIRARALEEPLTLEIDGNRYNLGRGSIVVPVNQKEVAPQVVHETVHRAIEEDYVTIYATAAGIPAEGPLLGSPSSMALEQPRVALLAGRGTGAYEVGEVWFALDQQMGLPVSLLELASLREMDLDSYNTLIMVSGNYSSLLEQEVDKLRDWIREGGCFIALRSAAVWAVRQDIVAETIKEVKPLDLDVPYSEVPQHRGAEIIGGSIFLARLDTTHPLAFGQPEEQALFRNHANFLEPSKTAGANVAVYTDDPLLSGYVSERNLSEIKNSGAVIARRVGRGSVILFADNPNFRAFWYGSQGLFLNAIFFGRSF